MGEQIVISVYFKQNNRAVIINTVCIGITGETEVSKERAIELIKNKKARLVLSRGVSVSLDIVKWAVAGAGAVIPPKIVVSILDNADERETIDIIQLNSSGIIIESMACTEIELDDDFIAVIEEDIINRLELVSYIINISEDNEVLVEHKGSKMMGHMLFRDRMNKLTFKQMHSMLKNGQIVSTYERGIISYKRLDDM